MKVLTCRNVAEALPLGLDLLLREGRREASRAGEVLVAPCPVATVYEKPCERVLFSAVRDANHAFHCMEALWMLAGRDDGAFLDNYVKDFSARFAEADGRIHGGYGARWRKGFGYDQLDWIADLLKVNPGDRQAVAQMWDCSAYENNHHDDLRRQWRDKPCNLSVAFKVRDSGLHHSLDAADPVLDITVFNRSNDIILGAYGANAVHMSLLQEYMAARIGVGVGAYTQVSHNYHVYTVEIERLMERAQRRIGIDAKNPNPDGSDYHLMDYLETKGLPLALMDDRYKTAGLAPAVLVAAPEAFDRELGRLMVALDDIHKDRAEAVRNYVLWPEMENTFLSATAWPMAQAMRLHRLGNKADAWQAACRIEAPDWAMAMKDWLGRRMSPAKAKLELGR